MRKKIIAVAGLLAAALLLIPDEASARMGGFGGRAGGGMGFRSGGVSSGFRSGGMGFRSAAFSPGFRSAAFHPGFRTAFAPGFRHGFHPGFRRAFFARRFRHRRAFFFATGALGYGLAGYDSPYYYGGDCYQVPAWALTPYGYQRVLVTQCY